MTLFSSSLRENIFVFFDFETTGLYSLSGDRVIEIAFVKVKDGYIIDKFDTLINPQKSIPEEASKVNNIFDIDVQDKPIFDYDISRKIIEFIKGAILVAHNIEFDLGFLSMELAINGFTYTDFRYIDTLSMCKFISKRNEKNKLQDWINRYNIQVNGALHRALQDTECLYKVFFNLIDENEIRGMKIDEIIQKFGGIETYERMENRIGKNVISNFGKKVKINYTNRNGEKVVLKVILKGPVWNYKDWYVYGNFLDGNRCFLAPGNILSIEDL